MKNRYSKWKKTEKGYTQLKITIEIVKKGKWFVAKCPELDFVAQGKTQNEAKQNLEEVIRIQFEEMSENRTLDEYLSECGYEKNGNLFNLSDRLIMSETFSFQIG